MYSLHAAGECGSFMLVHLVQSLCIFLACCEVLVHDVADKL